MWSVKRDTMLLLNEQKLKLKFIYIIFCCNLAEIIKMQGTVKFFNDSKGFGFITSDSGEDVFVHISALDGLNISEGDNVTFDIVDGNRGKAAGNVKIA